MTTTVPTEEVRRAIFLALVEAQDRGQAVAESRQDVSGRYGVDEQAVRDIEREGIDNQWPPLG